MVDVTVAPATHDRKLRDRHAGNRHDHLGTILGNTLLLVLRADDEARDVVQEDQWRPSLQPRPQTHASPGEAMLRRDSRSGHWVAATVRCAALRGIDVAAASTERNWCTRARVRGCPFGAKSRPTALPYKVVCMRTWPKLV